LDDIVSSNSRLRRGGGFRRGGGQQKRRGGFGGGAFGHDDRSEGGTFGHDDRSGGGVLRRPTGGRQRSNAPYATRDRSAGSVDSQWTHDLYQEEEDEEFIEKEEDFNNNGRRGLETGTKLQITNLAYSVLSDDLKDLFEAIGDVKRATVNFDKSGRSLGTATVVFSRRGDAIAAMKKYNNVPLDDSPMKVTLLGSALGGGGQIFGGNSLRAIHDEALTISVGAPRTRRIVAQGAGRGRRLVTNRNVGGRNVGGRNVGGRNAGGRAVGRTGGRGGRGGRGGFGRDRKQPATAEELDAEMDAYNQEANNE